MSSSKATYSMILCTLISERCKERGITQQQLFRDSGIASGTWSRIMRGQAHFQIEDLLSACTFLDWTVGAATTKADTFRKELEQKEKIEFASKNDLKNDNSQAGAFVAGAALAYLLMKAGNQ